MRTWMKWLSLSVIANSIAEALKSILQHRHHREGHSGDERILQRIRKLFLSRNQLTAFLYCFREPFHLLAKLRDWWNTILVRENRQLITNLSVGLLIAIFLHFTSNWQYFKDIEDATLDWMMRMFSGIPHGDSTLPFLWIDIDEETYITWGEPLYTPRDKLKRLIEFASEGGARIIVVDIDLARRSESRQADYNLQQYLVNYSKTCQAGKKNGCPPIILARTFRSYRDRNYRVERSSFLDNAVSSSDLIHWASPLYERSQDWVIRRWRLMEPVCAAEQLKLVPSIQLLTLGLLEARSYEDLSSQLQNRLTQHNCKEEQNRSFEAYRANSEEAPFILGEQELKLSKDRISRRIFFTMPWYTEPSKGSFSSEILPHPVVNGMRKLMVRVPAHMVPEPANRLPLDPSFFEGRVTVIGGSYAVSGDIHPTPLGAMPGALIIINAIQSLSQHGEITPLPLVSKLAIETLLILLMAIAFAIFNSFWGMMISGGLIIILLLPVTFLLIRSGIWLDFAIPLLAVQLHQLAANYEHYKETLVTLNRNKDQMK